ncbi:MAG: hypothetical protein VKP70_12535 [Cyanobacteriota bacterium]|nr:hypothetical protein [Cyanobacteriota bacterium]
MAAAPEVCVLTPHIEPTGSLPPAIPLARVPLSRPTLFVRESLAEIRLEGENTLLWSSRPPIGAPLEGPLAWPLGPLQPGQVVTLRLRPLGAEPDQFASIHLQGSPALRLKRGDALLRSLLDGPTTAWRPAIDALLAKGDRSLASALLFAQEGPNEVGLNALRHLAAQGSCP